MPLLHAKPEYEDGLNAVWNVRPEEFTGHMLTQRSGVPVYVAAIQIFR